MTQVYVGTAADARERRRALVQLDVAAVAAPANVFGRVGVFVPAENVAEARSLIDAIEHVVGPAAGWRVRNAVALRGGKSVGGVA